MRSKISSCFYVYHADSYRTQYCHASILASFVKASVSYRTKISLQSVSKNSKCKNFESRQFYNELTICVGCFYSKLHETLTFIWDSEGTSPSVLYASPRCVFVFKLSHKSQSWEDKFEGRFKWGPGGVQPASLLRPAPSYQPPPPPTSLLSSPPLYHPPSVTFLTYHVY